MRAKDFHGQAKQGVGEIGVGRLKNLSKSLEKTARIQPKASSCAVQVVGWNIRSSNRFRVGLLLPSRNSLQKENTLISYQ